MVQIFGLDEQNHPAYCYIYMATVFAQAPTHYPTGNYPMEFTLVNILVYIVFPVLLFVIAILIRRKKKHRDREEQTR